MDNKTIFVYENWSKAEPQQIGKLFVSHEKYTDSLSFEYDLQWLKSNYAIQLDPDLFLYKGRQFVQSGKEIFGVLGDSCPDRWGRLLLQRKEALIAKKENRKPRKLGEIDYLLGVYDESRMGALRFSSNEGKHFESSDSFLATPPF